MKLFSAKSGFLTLLAGMALASTLASCQSFNKVIISDDFSQKPLGIMAPSVGPELEYHYIAERFTDPDWVLTAFTSRVADTAFVIKSYEGRNTLFQQFKNNNRYDYTHPMLLTGDRFWKNYRAEVTVVPTAIKNRAGLAFRYFTDRAYYYFGMQNDSVAVVLVDDGKAFRLANEKVLAIEPFAWEAGKAYTLSVEARDNHFVCSVDGVQVIEFKDDTYASGPIAILSDQPAYFLKVEARTSNAEMNRMKRERDAEAAEWAALQAANPKPVLYSKFETAGFGTHRNVRFGDMNGDGRNDVLICQMKQHDYPYDGYAEVGCMTAMTLEGDIMWRIGEPDPFNTMVSNDVAFQIVDIDGDGRNEVVYTMNMELIVADGATGKTIRKVPTPEKKGQKYGFKRILGDCIYMCDVSGKGYDSDIVIKDRYWQFWVYNSDLKLLWTDKCNTGHYPYAADINGDGRDEILIGYSLYSPDGQRLWSLDSQLNDHADGVMIANLSDDPNAEPKVYIAASDEGFLRIDLKGNIEEHYHIGHVQNPVIGSFRDDLPGREIITINFWSNQGIVHFFDSTGKVYKVFEPLQAGSMMLPINWTGGTEEFYVFNGNPRDGGMYDGWGRKTVTFPADGHPDLCYAVLDVTGDSRDEVVVWDAGSMWVYTQDNQLPEDQICKYKRNPLYNYSNYQFTYSERVK